MCCFDWWKECLLVLGIVAEYVHNLSFLQALDAEPLKQHVRTHVACHGRCYGYPIVIRCLIRPGLIRYLYREIIISRAVEGGAHEMVALIAIRVVRRSCRIVFCRLCAIAAYHHVELFYTGNTWIVKLHDCII